MIITLSRSKGDRWIRYNCCCDAGIWKSFWMICLRFRTSIVVSRRFSTVLVTLGNSSSRCVFKKDSRDEIALDVMVMPNGKLKLSKLENTIHRIPIYQRAYLLASQQAFYFRQKCLVHRVLWKRIMVWVQSCPNGPEGNLLEQSSSYRGCKRVISSLEVPSLIQSFM